MLLHCRSTPPPPLIPHLPYDDPLDLLPLQRLKDYELVNAVDELGAEVGAHVIHHTLLYGASVSLLGSLHKMSVYLLAL